MSRKKSRRGPRVLELRLGPRLMESTSGMGLFRHETAPLVDVERGILRAGRDPRFAGVIVHLDELSPGWAKAEALHRALLAVRRAGKLTVATATSLGNASYLIASAAELVLLQPSTLLALEPLSAESLFVRDLLGSLGVTPELDHVGEFKTAGETFMRRSSSDEHRLEIDALLNDIERRFVELVYEARGLPPETLRLAAREGPLAADEALSRKLVDRLEGEERLDEILEERLGAKPRRLGLSRVVRKPGLLRRIWHARRRRIAVVHAVGFITMGEGRIARRGSSTMSARDLSETLRGLREDARVRAVVLRIESPGGGAVASDVIRAELERLAAVKPVVVSMGDVAASGGYFIATAAHGIVAESTTLTGSIGVIGGKMNVSRLLDRLGVHRETHATGEGAGFLSVLRPFSPGERERHRELLAHFYQRRFLPAVAAGRKLSLEQADAAGRGRVWTGHQGVSVGLVDVLGGLVDAVAIAREKARLPEEKTSVVYVSRRRKWRDVLTGGFGVFEPSATAELLEAASLLREISAERVLFLMDRWLRIR